MTRVANHSAGKMFTSDYDVVANHHYRQIELLVAGLDNYFHKIIHNIF